MSVLLLPPIFQFFDNNGDPLANGFVYTYAAGTTTPQATYTDSTGTVAAPNPIELNAAGRPNSGSGAIWGQGAYKFIVRNSSGVQIGDALDNVTSFTALASSANAYFQSFSGNGTQTVFTTSDDLGTEEKSLMVFLSKGLEEIAVNGTFASDTGWTKGAGWTIAAGVATATGAISTAISQVPVISLVAGQAYSVTYTITRSAGGLIPSLGGQNGTERTASGTYREIIIAAATTPIAFTGNAFTGTLDNVSITRCDSQGYDILSPSAFTINGTSLTFASAPATGTNNIYVFAPSLLLGAASSAAALAQTYAASAAVSAAAAALSAGAAKWKPAVACATTANITLSGEQTIDTVLTSASRVLVKNQSNQIENGVYVSGAGAWTRATDADTWTELVSQAVSVTGGSVNIRKNFVNTNEAGGTLGVDFVTWTELFIYPAPNSVLPSQQSSVASSGANADITSMTALASINSGQIAGFRNGIINGAFDVWQRGTSFTPSAGTVTYTADRWAAYRSGAAAFTVTRQGSALDNSQYCLRMSRDNGNASTAILQMAQSFESVNSYRYRNKKCTLRFMARAGALYSAASGALNVIVTTGTGTDEQALTGYTGSANPINTSVTLTTSWQQFSVTSAAVVSASATEIAAVFNFTPVGTAGATDYYEISEIELVEGSVADTYFERLDFPTTIMQCQRYYEKSFDYATAPAQNVGNANGAQIIFLSTGVTGTFGNAIRMRPKRVAPTITTYNPAATNANWRDTTNNADRTASVSSIGQNAFLVTGAAGVAASTNSIHFQADSEI